MRGCFSEERRLEGRRVQGDNPHTLPPQTPAMKTSLGDPSLLSYLGDNCPTSQAQPWQALRLRRGPRAWELQHGGRRDADLGQTLGLCCPSLCLGPLATSVPHPIHGLYSIAGPRRHSYLVAMQAFWTCGSQPFLP